MKNLESETKTTEKRLKKLLVGGLAAGVGALVTGNILDNDILIGSGYGFLAADAAIYLVYHFKIK